MTLALPGAPFPITYRELWLPPGINENASLPTSIEGGHGLTLTGARKGTTVDGVHFTGAVTSNINCGAIHNAAAKLYISFRFKLDQDFSSASGADLRLFGKFVGGADYIRVYLDAANGALVLASIVGGVWHFLITVATSWNAGQWYNVIASMSDVAGMRLRIDGGVAVVNPAYVDAVPNGGDFVIGDGDDPGAGTGFKGVIADFFCEEGVDLTAVEEYDLYAGFPPATVDNAYPLDEGRGVTAYDRGADGNDGTLDTSCTWAFGQVQQPVLSLDGINDVGISSAGINIARGVTTIWVGKMKSTYDGLAGSHVFYVFYLDADNRIGWYSDADNTMYYYDLGAGAGGTLTNALKPTIDEYWIQIGTITPGGIIALYLNGRLVDSDTGVGAIAGAATAYLGRIWVASDYDISKPLLVGLIDGAFTPKQALAYSRYLKNVFNLPIDI